MKNKDLEAKLLELDAKMAALGDLNGLLQRSGEAATVLQQAQEAKAKSDTLLPELIAAKEQTTALATELQTKNTTADEIIKKVQDQDSAITRIRKEVTEQLGVAANAKLSHTFGSTQKRLEIESYVWFGLFTIAMAALVSAAAFIVHSQLSAEGNLFELSFLIKIILTSPLVYYVVTVNREYKRVKNLIEEYTFKAAIAKSFSAYKEIIETAINAYGETDALKARLDFIISSVRDLYSSPMGNILKHDPKLKELSPDMISNLREVMETPDQKILTP